MIKEMTTLLMSDGKINDDITNMKKINNDINLIFDE